MKKCPLIRFLVHRISERLSRQATDHGEAPGYHLNVEPLEQRILFSGSPAPAPAANPIPAPAAETLPAQEASAPDIVEETNPVADGDVQEAAVATPPQPVADSSPSPKLSEADLEAVAAAAKERWIASGISGDQEAALSGVTYRVADLGGSQLGTTQGNTIIIDDDAAGSGSWFIDESPELDEEFLPGQIAALSAAPNSSASGAYDLLTTVLHEQGHLLGLSGDNGANNSLMGETLALGERRLPGGDQAEGAVPNVLTSPAFLHADDGLLTVLAEREMAELPPQSGVGYGTESVVTANGNTEHHLKLHGHHFASVFIDETLTGTGVNGTSVIRLHPGVDQNGWGSSLHLQAFTPGSTLRGSQIDSVTEQPGGIVVEMSGFVSADHDEQYGDWSASLTFTYDPSTKKVEVDGTYEIDLDGVIAGAPATVTELNLYKLASNYLKDVPLLDGTTGNTGDVSAVTYTRDDGTHNWNFVSTFPQNITDDLEVNAEGGYYDVDLIAQGRNVPAADVGIKPAYKPSLLVDLQSQHQGIEMIFGAIYENGQSDKFELDNVGITPLIKSSSTRTTFAFDLHIESEAPAGDGLGKEFDLRGTIDSTDPSLEVYHSPALNSSFNALVGELTRVGHNLYEGTVFVPFDEVGDSSFFKTDHRVAELDTAGAHRGNQFFTGESVIAFGFASDTPLVGNWNGQGDDDIGVRRGNQFIFDFNGNGSWDGSAGGDKIHTFGRATDKAVIGDWDGDGDDDIGVRRGNQFILDFNGNGIWDGAAGGDKIFIFGQVADRAVAGDWDGDGDDDIGVRRANQFFLDADGSGTWTGASDRIYTFGQASDTPLAGDWNGDGTDEVGVQRNNRFIFDANGNGVWDGAAGGDHLESYGLVGDTPLIGNFLRPPGAVGVHRGNQFILDANGNGIWDGTAGGDRIVVFGQAADKAVTGDWNGDGTDEAGVRRGNQFILDANGNGTWDGTAGGDKIITFGQVADEAITGDWDGDGVDDAGVRRGNQFILDANGNETWDGTAGGDKFITFGQFEDGVVTGDWDGDGKDDIGVRRGNRFILDANGNGPWDGTGSGDKVTTFGQVADTAVTGDWNGDGADDVGVHRGNQFIFDANGSGDWDGIAGGDKIIAFGEVGDTPLAGNWASAPAKPLMAAGGVALPSTSFISAPQALTREQLLPLVGEAILVWERTGLVSQGQLRRLENITVSIADLRGATLGLARDGDITLDLDAAGYGWFIDSSPRSHEEFFAVVDPGEDGDDDGWTAVEGSEAEGRIDLLTALMHEMGHLMGFEHEEGSTMSESLGAGVRRMPGGV